LHGKHHYIIGYLEANQERSCYCIISSLH